MEMRELIDLIEEQQLIAELPAEKKLGKLGKAMATIGAIRSLATAQRCCRTRSCIRFIRL